MLLMMELTELSLAPKYNLAVEKSSNSSSSESERYTNSSTSRKRKFSSSYINSTEHQNHDDHHLLNTIGGPASTQASVDLQVRDPLPLDWEQCLDLESGRMYYMNRKTSRKTWNWPKDHHQKLDLELNISSKNIFPDQTLLKEDPNNNISCKKSSTSSSSSSSSSSSNMVALACLNCHLLVILSKSCPSCPNCKFVHPLPPSSHSKVASPPPPHLSTLSLLN